MWFGNGRLKEEETGNLIFTPQPVSSLEGQQNNRRRKETDNLCGVLIDTKGLFPEISPSPGTTPIRSMFIYTDKKKSNLCLDFNVLSTIQVPLGQSKKKEEKKRRKRRRRRGRRGRKKKERMCRQTGRQVCRQK